MPGRAICLETENHKSSPDLLCSQHGALEGSKTQLLCCLNTLSNATNYFHFMNLGMGILQSSLTYEPILFCFVFFSSADVLPVLQLIHLMFLWRALLGAATSLTVQGDPFKNRLLCWWNRIKYMHGWFWPLLSSSEATRMHDSMQTDCLPTFAKHPTHRWGHQHTFFNGDINIARFVSGKINDEFFSSTFV